MEGSIVKYLGDQPLMVVLRGMLVSSTPRHLRGLAFQYSLSPSGVSDIIRRLKQIGIVNETNTGNKKCYSLNLLPDERKCLESFFSICEARFLEERAAKYSKNAAAKLEWMDETAAFYRSVKEKSQ